MGLYRRVLSYVAAYPAVIVGAVLATIGFAALDAFSIIMLIPFLRQLFGEPPLSVGGADQEIQELLSRTIGILLDPAADPQAQLLRIILIMLGVFLAKNLFDFLQQYLATWLEQAVTRDLRNQVYEHLLALDLRFFGRTRAGQIISRLTTDVDQLRMLVTRNLAKLATAIFQIAATLAALLLISLELTFVAIIVLPAMFGIWGRLLRRLRTGDRRVLNLAGEVSSQLQETVSGIRLVKSFTAERYEGSRFRQLTGDYYRTYLRTEALRALAGPMTEMMAAVGTVLLLWYGSRLVLVEGAMDGATFITFLALSMKLYSPVKWTSKFPSIIQPGLAAAERIFEFLDAPAETRARQGARVFDGVHERIRFEDVHFHYEPDEPVLEGFSLEVRRGEVVALVGPSGAGKTTVVDLIARFYDPVHGRITIDDTDLRELTIASVRAQLGIVTQETVLFHDTVRSNIAYGLADASAEALERAARAAHAHEFIVALPQGYDTVLGERGTRLSGGQRQRIAIARALLRDPPILILDEATSALDTESERLVQDAIERLLEGRTVFVIAHRLSTTRHADQIVVLKEGRIVERGRHDELLARGGAYHRLYELQFAGRERAARVVATESLGQP